MHLWLFKRVAIEYCNLKTTSLTCLHFASRKENNMDADFMLLSSLINLHLQGSHVFLIKIMYAHHKGTHVNYSCLSNMWKCKIVLMCSPYLFLIYHWKKLTASPHNTNVSPVLLISCLLIEHFITSEWGSSFRLTKYRVDTAQCKSYSIPGFLLWFYHSL